jgi:hypothetical protein
MRKQPIMIAARLAVAVSIVLAIGRTALGRPDAFNLDMSQDPGSFGWQVLQGNPPGSHTVANGILSINSPTFYEFVAPSAVLNSLSNTTGWAVETRFRFSGGFNDMTIWVHDGTELNLCRIGSSSVLMYAGAIGYEPEFPYPIGNVYHDYRLEGIGRHTRLLVDGNVVYDMDHLAPGGGTRSINFGDGSWSFATTSDWDYFRIMPLPEPSVAALLVPAIILLRRRRHRGQPD